jgi:hypothetical protein
MHGTGLPLPDPSARAICVGNNTFTAFCAHQADLPLQTARLARACTVCEDSSVNRANKTD